ncbi:MAG: hypothetical protein RL215_1170 [Planctomycetota bacterium]
MFRPERRAVSATTSAKSFLETSPEQEQVTRIPPGLRIRSADSLSRT